MCLFYRLCFTLVFPKLELKRGPLVSRGTIFLLPNWDIIRIFPAPNFPICMRPPMELIIAIKIKVHRCHENQIKRFRYLPFNTNRHQWHQIDHFGLNKCISIWKCGNSPPYSVEKIVCITFDVWFVGNYHSIIWKHCTKIYI